MKVTTMKPLKFRKCSQFLGRIIALSTVLLAANASDAATFNIANGDVTALKSAITNANSNNQADTINLAANALYTLTAPHNNIDGPTGLPAIINDLNGQDLTINGNGATIERSGASDFRLLNIRDGAGVRISRLTISSGQLRTGNEDFDNGGGILNSNGSLTLDACKIINNTATFGAGIINFAENATATLDLTNCTISNNAAAESGGGIESFSESGGTARVTLTNCTISGNSAFIEGGGIKNAAEGGTATVALANCTLSDNSSPKGHSLYNDGVRNTGGSLTVSLANSIFKIGTAGNNIVNGGQGVITSLGYNLSSDNGSGFLLASGDKINSNPKLGPLANNGGSTPTHALLLGSPAINAGKSSLTTDQRGYGRVGAPDIGAFEFDGTPPVAYRVDALIKKNSDASTAYAINDAYQSVPHGTQIETLSIGNNGTAIYQVKVQNDTNVTRTFGVKAVETAGAGWSIVYQRGTLDISAAVRSSSGHKTASLAPGASEIITVRVTPGNTVSIGASKSATLKVFLGGADKVARDAVKATTKVVTAGCSVCTA